MSDLITAPEMLISTAADVESIGSAIRTAGADAAGPTTGLVAAAEDEVSAAIANVFGGYGREYQAIVAQAATFHSEFTEALAAAASAYARAEAANAARVSGISRELGAPMRALLGQAPVAGGTGPLLSTAKLSSGDPLIALIMGGTGNPDPLPSYVDSVFNAYIRPSFPAALPQGLFTPQELWPLDGNLTWAQSVSEGVTLLNNALVGPTGVITQGNSAVVFGYSQSATIIGKEINALSALPTAVQPSPSQLSFVLIGDLNNPVGGIFARFPGFYIPFLDVPFNGATPQSPWHTSVYTIQYDGLADFPQYPLNVVSDVNALFGLSLHVSQQNLTAIQVANSVPLPTNGGNTSYYLLLTQNLPLLQPIRAIPGVGPVIADIFQPDLRVVVDLGYADYATPGNPFGGNFANIPTPAGLFSIPDPFTVIPYLAIGAVQGPYGAIVQIGVDAGLLSPSLFPTTYPWVPSIDPHLHFFLGQPSTTLLSVLSGAAGDVLHRIPPGNIG